MSDKVLTESQRDLYEQQGLLFPIEVLSAEDVRHFRAACEDLEARLGGKPKTVQVRQMHLHFRWAYELAAHSRILDAVQDVLGPDLMIWATELFAKHPHDSAISIGWHRDQPYLGFDCRHTVTAWIALSDSTTENGCMQAVLEPDRRKSAAETKTNTGNAASQQNFSDHDLINVTLRAGEMSLHDGHLPHGSGPNQSADKRIGFVVRFVSPEAQPRTERSPAVLVRGVDRYGHFQSVDPPREAMMDDALAGLKKSATDHLESMLGNLKQQHA